MAIMPILSNPLSSKRANREEKGFTLTETLVALAILSAASVGFLTVFGATMNRGATLQTQMQATQILANATAAWPFGDAVSYPGQGQVLIKRQHQSAHKRTCLVLANLTARFADYDIETAILVPGSVRNAC